MSIGKLLKSIVGFVFLLVIGLAAFVYWFAVSDRSNDYPVVLDDMVIPEFDRQSIAFAPTFDGTKTLPFAAGAVVDIDNDGVEEIFLGGGIDQPDALYKFDNGVFTEITETTGWSKQTPDKTFSATSLDLDRDGDNDLLVTRQSGVYLYRNDNASFSVEKLALDIDPKTVPLSAAIGDINKDGLYDLYVSGYIAREHVEGETIFNQEYGGISGLFLNLGDDKFENITESAGMQYQHNTFQSVFIDVDQDQLADLVVAHDTGQVRTWKNMGDMTFQNMSNPTSDYFSYPMGIGVTDLKNDGLPDFFFSNVGSTVPSALVRGDLREDQELNADWILFNNQGGFQFEDTAEEAQIADYEFSWGAVFEDFNLDGRDDLVVSENYEGWPLHGLAALRLDGRFLLQNSEGQFIEAGPESGVRNRAYGISPLTADFNQDGYPDLIHVNLLGEQNVFISKGGDQGFLKVRLPNTVDSVGANVTVQLSDGSKQVRQFVIGEGLVSDQSHVLIFGLGDQQATSILIEKLDGGTEEITGDFQNEIIDIEYGS